MLVSVILGEKFVSAYNCSNSRSDLTLSANRQNLMLPVRIGRTAS